MRYENQRPSRNGCLFIGALIVILVLSGACGGGDEETAAQETPGGTTATEAVPAEPASALVELQWLPSAEHLGLYYGVEKGFFEQEQLDVELHPPSDPSAPLKLVAVNRVELAVSYAPEVLIAQQEDLDIVAVGSIMPVPLASFIATADSGVTGPADLRDKRLGYTAGVAMVEAMAETALETVGLTTDDTKLVNVGFNATAAALSEKVDALIGFYRNGTAVELEIQTGEEPVVIPVDELGMPTYDELVLVANKTKLETDPEYADVVRRFLRAYVSATEAALGDPEGGLEVIQDVTEDDPGLIDAQFESTLPLLQPTDGRSLGCFVVENWADLSTWMQEEGVLEEPVDVDEVATNDYLPAC